MIESRVSIPWIAFRKPLIAAISLAAAIAAAEEDRLALVQHSELAPLPVAVSNNAVATVRAGRREYLVSFNGLGEGKTHADTLASTFVYDSRSRSWTEADPVPGDAGRLVQKAEGYVATIKSGEVTMSEGESTGTMPGSLLRGAR